MMRLVCQLIVVMAALWVELGVSQVETEDFYPAKDDILSYQSLESPFRMQKVNLLWEKARRNLSEGKLRILYSELKIQDKEEITLKRLKAEGSDSKDKSGLREAEVRKRFNGILNKYGLAGYFPGSDEDKNTNVEASKLIFKDKKLNKLWEKAEKAGLSEEEMITLKQEFQHHQEKVDQYNNLLRISSTLEDSDLRSNEIHFNDDQDEDQIHPNELNGKRKEVKESFQRLHRLATNTQDHKEFDDHKVEALWKLAREADFNQEELKSIKQELHHFEIRLQKLEFLRQELNLVDERHGGKKASFEGGDINEDVKTEGRKIMDKKLQKNMLEAEKMERHLERTIASRHSEL